MAKATPIIAAFNAGEWSPLLEGRTDLAGYGASAVAIENFICTVQGPLVRRTGSRFVSAVEDNAKRSWLVPFVRSRSIAYIIEFADSKCRFYFDRAQVTSGPSAYEIASPYSATDLVNAEGEFNLDFVQSRDVLYITHRGGTIAPRKLSRTSSTSWAFSTVEPNTGPFLAPNSGAVTIYADGASGSGVTLTASSSIFTADDVGSLIRLDQVKITATEPWESSKAYTSGDFVRSEGKEYEAASSGTSGTTVPGHTRGTVSDGGVQWTYRSAGFGVARITAQSGTTATVDVLTRFPQTVVGSSNATANWRKGAWSGANGYPTTVAFFNERLVYGQSQRVDMSVVADYDNFAPDEFGEIVADSAISVDLQSSQANDVTGLLEGGTLVVMTEGAEFTIGALTTSEPFGPGNIQVSLETAYGSRPVRPIRVGEAALFLQASGRKLRELTFDIQVNRLIARDMIVRSEHLARPRIVGVTRQEEPWQLVWAWRSDGVVLSFTYDRTQEVRGWSRHVLGGAFADGAAVVESMATIPSPDGTRDDVWMIVKRTINGGTVRYIEFLEAEYREGDAQENAFYVDSGLTYDGAATTTISGLDHLEGETVCVLADGGTHPDVTVDDGTVTLERETSVAQIGYCPRCVWGSHRLDAGAADGSAQTKTKRITDASFRVHLTLGGRAGPSETSTDAIPALNYRDPATPMGAPPPLYSGDALVDWPEGYGTAGRIYYTNDQPFPVTLVAVVPQVVTMEAR